MTMVMNEKSIQMRKKRATKGILNRTMKKKQMMRKDMEVEEEDILTIDELEELGYAAF